MINKECLQSWNDSQGRKAGDEALIIEKNIQRERKRIQEQILNATKFVKSNEVPLCNYNLEQYRP